MSLTYTPPLNATVLKGGSWIAVKDVDGKTYYQSATGTDATASAIAGATKYAGPVIISGGSLTVASGAVASGAYVSGGTNNVFIVSGGTLESSVNVNGWTYVRSGGVSSDNTLVSDAGNVAAGGSSVSDTFLAGTATDGGGDAYTVVSGGYIGGSATVASGITLNINAGATSQPIAVQNGGTLNLAGAATTVGSGSAASSIGGDSTVSPQYPVAPTGATVLNGGSWIAVKDVDGKTYYQSATGTDATASAILGATKYAGPVIISGGSLTVASGAVASGAYVSGGTNTVFIRSGGTLESSVNVNGWTYVRSGGISSDNTLVSDAGNVAAGGSSVSDTFLAGTAVDGGSDTYTVNSGGYISGKAVVGSGTTLAVASGATVAQSPSYYITYPQPSYLSATVLSGGTWIAVKDTDGKTYYQSATGTDTSAKAIAGATKYSGPVIISGGSLTVASGAVASGAYVSGGTNNIFIVSGGTLESSVNVNGWTYVRSGGVSSDNTLVSDAGTIAAGGSSVSDTLIAGKGNDGGGDTYTVSDGGSVTSSFVGSGAALRVNTGGVSDSPTIEAGGSYYVTQATSLVCFLPGSMINTPTGGVAIEDIRIGDSVITFDWRTNKNVVAKVKWAGKAHATVRRSLPDDEAGWPVRILKDAVADGVPYKDMLITAEHCLFFDGKFLPVRMLVNGRSIYYDKSISVYDYYHIETAEHAVIMADGMLTESYLDTGNRQAFRQEGSVAAFGTKRRTWDDAAAELCVDRAMVEPVFNRLVQRAELRDVPLKTPSVTEIFNDPNLQLITEAGQVLYPVRQSEQTYSFLLSPGLHSVRIVSRAARPMDVIGPFVDDRRMLGVAVSAIRYVTGQETTELSVHLQAKKPKGWLDGTACEQAWTNGDALLPLPEREPTCGPIVLSLTLRAAGPYVVRKRSEEFKKALSA
ncbi:MAG: Hint domain-containing protein [Acetobacter sp.]|uniref:Hint domain-containing protein n=1 Tax=Acetobacter sp. TaxID=440 RepID=UPI003F8E596F